MRIVRDLSAGRSGKYPVVFMSDQTANLNHRFSCHLITPKNNLIMSSVPQDLNRIVLGPRIECGRLGCSPGCQSLRSTNQTCLCAVWPARFCLHFVF